MASLAGVTVKKRQGMVRSRDQLLLAPVLLFLMRSEIGTCSALTSTLHKDMASSAMCSRLDQHAAMQGCCAPFTVVAGCGHLKLRGGGGGLSHLRGKVWAHVGTAATDANYRGKLHRGLSVLGGGRDTGIERTGIERPCGKNPLKCSAKHDWVGEDDNVSRLRGGDGGQEAGMTDSRDQSFKDEQVRNR